MTHIELESTFQRKFKKRLDELPNSVFFVKEAGSIRGISDIIGCCNGRFVALELKRSMREASKKTGRIVLQRHFLTKISRADGFSAMVYPENADYIFNLLESMAHKKLSHPSPS